jgi:hypothetical protein
MAFLFLAAFAASAGLRAAMLTICALALCARLRESLALLAQLPRDVAIAGAAWLAVCLASVAWSVDPKFSLGEVKPEIVYPLLAFVVFFVAAARDPSPIKTIDPAAPDLEGYLFPKSYLLPRRTDASRLVRTMTARFEQVFTPAVRQAAEGRGLTVRQVVTLASIVEKEAARPEERPIVAAVYENRLRIGMPLQCDPTVIYALERSGKYTGNLRREDLAFDSPYNTYRYPGLPPGPIASPGRASLEAAVHPAQVDFLYFVSRNDGSHEFARTLEEHNRNVQKWQVQYFRDQRALGR